MENIFWQPIADFSLATIALILLPALIVDFGWGFLVKVVGVVSSRLRSRWRVYRLSRDRLRSEAIQERLRADRTRLAELRESNDYREAERVLARIRQAEADYRADFNKIKDLEPAPPYLPKVSVIIPCHNSEDVIEETLDAVTQLNYPDLDIVVVDDGSTDATAQKVLDFIEPQAADGASSPISLVKRGHTSGLKTGAINFGLGFATGDVIFVVDDDTAPAPDSVFEVVQPLRDEHVAACAGNIRVNDGTLNSLVRLEELEYMQLMEINQAWHSLAYRGVFVISGAFGAFKRQYLAQIGEYDIGTVAEDMDITWKLYLLRKEVRFAPGARARTVVPDNLRDLLKQRRRWDLGMLQNIQKHRNMLFKRRYGRFGMIQLPEALFLNVFMSIIKPIYIVALIVYGFNIWQIVLLTAYFYILLEAVSIAAAGLLGGEKRSALRFYYAPLMIIYRLGLTVVLAGEIIGFKRKRETV